MCPNFKRIFCENCINKWLEQHTFCGICKSNLSTLDLIEIPFLDEMPTFFIKNIDNMEKNKTIDSEEESLKNNNDKDQKKFLAR